jgi:hypothetical protein
VVFRVGGPQIVTINQRNKKWEKTVGEWATHAYPLLGIRDCRGQ